MIQSVLQRLDVPEAAPVWSAVSGLLFAGVYGLVWIAAQALAVTITGGDLSRPTLTALALGVFIASLLSAIVVVQWVRRRVGDEWPRALHLESSHSLPLFVCLLLGLASAWAVDLIGVLLRLKGGQIVPPSLEILAQRDAPAVGWVIAALVAVIVQPIGEELIFRGLLYPSLAARLGNRLSILLTSIAFTVLTLILAGPLPWYALLQPLLMSVAVTALRAHTQSTQMAIVARAMFGLFFVLSALISARF